MAFEIGHRVVVLPLGRKPGVVVEAGRGGHYRVQVENTTVSCREGDLAPAEPQRGRRARAEPVPGAKAVDDTEPAVAAAIDLHGLTVQDALARVVDAIDHALREGADRLEVVHGKGSGRIRAALHRHLRTLTVVASYRLDARNPGVTWIYF